MGSRFEVEVTVTSARDLKNVNWRHGELKPYAVLWVEDGPKCSTKVAIDGDANPIFEEKVTLPVPPLPPGRRLEDCTLYVDLVHARSEGEEDTKPLIGSARLPLRDVLEEVGIGGGRLDRNLKLKRPSGRPHGKIELRVAIKDPQRYYDRYAAPSPPYGQPAGSRDYGGGYGQTLPPQPAYGGYGQQQPPAYGGGYGQQPYGATAAPPVGYPYGAPPAPVTYDGGAPAQMYGGGQSAGGYGYGYAAEEKKKKSGMGVGTGLAVGAVAGVLGGLALAEGVDYVEDKIEDHVAERVEDDLAYEDGGYDDF